MYSHRSDAVRGQPDSLGAPVARLCSMVYATLSLHSLSLSIFGASRTTYYMKLYTDASRDDDIAGLGWVVTLDDGSVIEESRYMLGEYTSMESEYYALLDGIRHSAKRPDTELAIHVDCQPLVNKMRYPDSDNELWERRRQGFLWLANKFDVWSIEWVPREANESANRLAFEALERGRRA